MHPHRGARKGAASPGGNPPGERTALGGNPQSIVSYSMRKSLFNNHNATWQVSYQVTCCVLTWETRHIPTQVT